VDEQAEAPSCRDAPLKFCAPEGRCATRPQRALRATTGGVTPRVQNLPVSNRDPTDDPVPRTVVLDLDEAFRVREALEDARLALREHGAAPGLQDELATVIRVVHGNWVSMKVVCCD
jgi:hypothetical protein